MIYGCDAASVPDAATLQRIRARGWSFWLGYLGGLRAMHAYTPDEWQRINDAGFGLGALIVGRNLSDRPGETWDTPADFTQANGAAEADQALAQAAALGIPAGAPLGLDVEGQCASLGAELDAYVLGMSQEIRAAGRPFLLYSSGTILQRFGSSVVDLRWGADWSGTFTPDPPVGQYDPASPPPWDIWQYGGGSLEGASVDVNAARDDYPLFQLGGPPMPTPDPTPTPEPDYRVALASVTAPTGEIRPAIAAAMKATSAKAMRAAIKPIDVRLGAIYDEFQP